MVVSASKYLLATAITLEKPRKYMLSMQIWVFFFMQVAKAAKLVVAWSGLELLVELGAVLEV